MADWNRIGMALGGFAAGMGGMGPQYMAMVQRNRQIQLQQEEQKRREAQVRQLSTRQKTGRMIQMAKQAAASGTPQGVVYANNMLDQIMQGVPGAANNPDLQQAKIALQGMQSTGGAILPGRGPAASQTQAVGILDSLESKFIAEGLLEQPTAQGTKLGKPGDYVLDAQGNVIRQLPADPDSQDPVNLNISGGAFRFKDSNDNVYDVRTGINPRTGAVQAIYNPLSPDAPPEPVGEIKPLDDMGMTAEERIAYEGRASSERRRSTNAADMAKDFFTQLGEVNQNIALLEEARQAVASGAPSGPFVSRLPAITEGAIKLRNIQSRLGLEVVSSVTFGALSESELRLALDTGLPVDLQGEQLVKWIEDRVNAQQKLAGFLNDAAIHFERNGTIEDFLNPEIPEDIRNMSTEEINAALGL